MAVRWPCGGAGRSGVTVQPAPQDRALAPQRRDGRREEPAPVFSAPVPSLRCPLPGRSSALPGTRLNSYRLECPLGPPRCRLRRSAALRAGPRILRQTRDWRHGAGALKREAKAEGTAVGKVTRLTVHPRGANENARVPVGGRPGASSSWRIRQTTDSGKCTCCSVPRRWRRRSRGHSRRCHPGVGWRPRRPPRNRRPSASSGLGTTCSGQWAAR